MRRIAFLVAVLLVAVTVAAQSNLPPVTEVDHVIRDFRFDSGETLPELKLHAYTLGAPQRDAQGMVRNAVLIMHGTGGSGRQFLNDRFGGALFGPGQLLDAARYYIILPDAIGHGRSSKPSDGLRMRFPKYDYNDMVRAQYRLLTEKLGVNHLRLVMGTSMGGMHTWVWGYTYPDFMDALLPLASAPVEIAGRNRMWRWLMMDAIRSDPEWKNGDYERQPRGLREAQRILFLVGGSPLQYHRAAPTRAEAEAFIARRMESAGQSVDANDTLYQFDASRTYDPSPHLVKITAPLVAVNTADDLINPPELGFLEREIKKVKRGRYVLLPISEKTVGHGSHTVAALWAEHLEALLRESGRTNR